MYWNWGPKVLSTARDVAKSTLSVDSLTKGALLDKAKQFTDTALQKGKTITENITSSLGDKLGRVTVDKLKGTTKVPQSVKDAMTSLANDPHIKKALTGKVKDILTQSSLAHPKLNAAWQYSHTIKHYRW